MSEDIRSGNDRINPYFNQCFQFDEGEWVIPHVGSIYRSLKNIPIFWSLNHLYGKILPLWGGPSCGEKRAEHRLGKILNSEKELSKFSISLRPWEDQYSKFLEQLFGGINV